MSFEQWLKTNRSMSIKEFWDYPEDIKHLLIDAYFTELYGGSLNEQNDL